MSHRKSPYEHEVKPHTRSGVSVKKYKRGKGRAPQRRASDLRIGVTGSYNVTWFFSNGTSETYNVGGGSLTSAIRKAIPLIQQPLLPTRAQIRRNQR